MAAFPMTETSDQQSDKSVNFQIHDLKETDQTGLPKVQQIEFNIRSRGDASSKTAQAAVDVSFLSSPDGVVELPRLPPAEPVLADRVSGNVLQFDETSVLCEIDTSNGISRVTLPAALFEIPLSVGLPICVKLKTSGGIRRLEVSKRNVGQAKNQAALREIDELIEQL